jgi:hypothetical protein
MLIIEVSMVETIRDAVKRAIVVCYKENVDQLAAALLDSGIPPIVQRGAYSAEDLRRPAAMRTFMNHRDAWKVASNADGYTLICEADFVPCHDMGSLPVFWPLDNPHAWGYLYQGSPRILGVIGSGRHIRAHCAPLVAYVVNAKVADMMLRFFDWAAASQGLDNYFSFESWLQWNVMGQGGEAYIPIKHYGEHGGLPNAEHKASGAVSRAGRHRADNLARPLAFLPQYAAGSRLRYAKERAMARALGIGRLFSGRWIAQIGDTHIYPRDLASLRAMYFVGARRVFM